MDGKERPDEKNMKVDAEKIINHINYTRHWLDRADEDYKSNKFSSGSMVLGLARAELTAAWEEALQLKTEVFHKLPRKAKNMANWKNASAAGLLAAGFLMAFIIIQFGNSSLLNAPGNRSVSEMASPIIVSEEKAPAAKTTATEPSGGDKAIIIDEDIVNAAPARVSPLESMPRRSNGARMVHGRSASVKAVSAPVETPAPQPVAVQPVETPAPQPVAVQPVETPAPAKPRQKVDGIDLYKTASDAINR